MAKKKVEEQGIEEIIDDVTDVMNAGGEYLEAAGEVIGDNLKELGENIEIIGDAALDFAKDKFHEAVDGAKEAYGVVEDAVTEFNKDVQKKLDGKHKTSEMATPTNDEKKEITIKTAKGLVGDPFKAKDGKEYCEVKIPNKDENDKSPWKSFVVRAAQVHDDKFGKGKWFKLPAEGTTTVSQSVITGQDENGKNVYENTKERVTNSELKDMVEFYKDRDRSQEQTAENKVEDMVADKPATAKSFKDQIKEAKAEAKRENEKTLDKGKTKAKTKSYGIE